MPSPSVSNVPPCRGETLAQNATTTAVSRPRTGGWRRCMKWDAVVCEPRVSEGLQKTGAPQRTFRNSAVSIENSLMGDLYPQKATWDSGCIHRIANLHAFDPG